MPALHEITQLLQKWSGGARAALDQLIPLVYDELRGQAARNLRRERAGHTLQQFFGTAATLMRRILIDHARSKRATRRGGGELKLTLDAALGVTDEPTLDLPEIDELTKLSVLDERQSRIVELRFFAGMSVEETAEALGIAPSTVKRNWQVTKAWIRRELRARESTG